MVKTLSVAHWGGPNEPFQLDTRPAIHHQPGQSFAADRLWEYADGDLGFYGWLRVVNRRIERVLFAISGFGLMDLPDRLWRDEYDDRVPPGEAADIAIDETAAEFGIDPLWLPYRRPGHPATALHRTLNAPPTPSRTNEETPMSDAPAPHPEAPHDGDDEYPPPCANPDGHSWVVSEEDGRCYCEYCLVHGDA